MISFISPQNMGMVYTRPQRYSKLNTIYLNTNLFLAIFSPMIKTTPVNRSCLLSELFFYFTWSRSMTKSSIELSLYSRSMSFI